jgi:hypothetical protein
MNRGSAKFFNFLCLVGVLLVGTYAATMFHSAHLLAEESAQRALLDEAAALLDAYHREHGRYPESLQQLAFTYPDGGDRSTLESLEYNSDGEYFIVKTIGASSGKEFRVCR